MRVYSALIALCAFVAGGLLLLVFAAIVVDVLLRALGFQPSYWTTPFSEYAMLYATMLGSPWVVRRKGHVAVESLVSALAPGVRRLLESSIYLLCIAASLLFVYYSWQVLSSAWVSGERDIRAAELPRWVLFAVMPPGFLLIAAEFVRLLARGESYFGGEPASRPSV